MNCSKCNQTIQAGFGFCGKCGQPVESFSESAATDEQLTGGNFGNLSSATSRNVPDSPKNSKDRLMVIALIVALVALILYAVIPHGNITLDKSAVEQNMKENRWTASCPLKMKGNVGDTFECIGNAYAGNVGSLYKITCKLQVTITSEKGDFTWSKLPCVEQ